MASSHSPRRQVLLRVRCGSRAAQPQLWLVPGWMTARALSGVQELTQSVVAYREQDSAQRDTACCPECGLGCSSAGKNSLRVPMALLGGGIPSLPVASLVSGGSGSASPDLPFFWLQQLREREKQAYPAGELSWSAQRRLCVCVCVRVLWPLLSRWGPSGRDCPCSPPAVFLPPAQVRPLLGPGPGASPPPRLVLPPGAGPVSRECRPLRGREGGWLGSPASSPPQELQRLGASPSLSVGADPV